MFLGIATVQGTSYHVIELCGMLGRALLVSAWALTCQPPHRQGLCFILSTFVQYSSYFLCGHFPVSVVAIQ